MALLAGKLTVMLVGLFATVLLHHAHRAFAHFVGQTIRFLAQGSIFSKFGASSIPGAIHLLIRPKFDKRKRNATFCTARKHLSMKKTRTPRLPEGTQPAESLSKVLRDSEHVHGIVKESATELAKVNSALNKELSNQNSLPEVETALEKSEAVEVKVQDASEKLTRVNRDLRKEVKELHLMEHELSKVMEQQKEALHASLHDALTGLPNRLLFNDRLEHGMEQVKRHDWTLAVMFLDLDKFKTINDTYGHAAGDAVLLTIAKRLKDTTRSDDTLCRLGGDEFLYLLTEVNDDQDAAIVANKIITALQVPCDVEAGAMKVSVSIGISTYPKDGTTAEALITSADTAMYRAKHTKSGFAFASDNPAPPR